MQKTTLPMKITKKAAKKAKKKTTKKVLPMEVGQIPMPVN